MVEKIRWFWELFAKYLIHRRETSVVVSIPSFPALLWWCSFTFNVVLMLLDDSRKDLADLKI